MANSIFLSFNGFADQGGGSVSTPGSITAGSAATGSFYAADGTSALPSYSFTSDPNSGLFSLANDVFGVSINGTNILDFRAGTMRLGAATALEWNNDLRLTRQAAGVVQVGTTASNNLGAVDATLYKAAGVNGVATFGPAAVVSITVRGGIITAIS